LIPFLKDARRQGNTAFLKKDKLVVNRKIYELEHLKKNFRMESEVQIRDLPMEGKEMSQRRSQIKSRNSRAGRNRSRRGADRPRRRYVISGKERRARR
jgi:hypothetical protein